LGKLSEVLYEVDCGRNNEPQIIHCDRLKRKVKQRLREFPHPHICRNRFYPRGHVINKI
jgi:hypothetical protein